MSDCFLSDKTIVTLKYFRRFCPKKTLKFSPKFTIWDKFFVIQGYIFSPWLAFKVYLIWYPSMFRSYKDFILFINPYLDMLVKINTIMITNWRKSIFSNKKKNRRLPVEKFLSPQINESKPYTKMSRVREGF